MKVRKVPVGQSFSVMGSEVEVQVKGRRVKLNFPVAVQNDPQNQGMVATDGVSMVEGQTRQLQLLTCRAKVIFTGFEGKDLVCFKVKIVNSAKGRSYQKDRRQSCKRGKGFRRNYVPQNAE